jgi:hypothetical protein
LQKQSFHAAKKEASEKMNKILRDISSHVGHIYESIGKAMTYTKIEGCVYMISVRASKKIL